MSGLIVAMLVLCVCWKMWHHYRFSAKCDYCGGEWKRHQEDCPWAGTGL